MFTPNKNSYFARQIPDLAGPNRNLGLKIIYKGCFKSFAALYPDRICSDQHFVENRIEKFPSV